MSAPYRLLQPEQRSVSAPTVCMIAPIPGIIKEISASGLRIETWDSLTVQRNYVFSIGQSGNRARVRCRVVACLLSRTERTGNGDVIPIYQIRADFVGYGTT